MPPGCDIQRHWIGEFIFFRYQNLLDHFFLLVGGFENFVSAGAVENFGFDILNPLEKGCWCVDLPFFYIWFCYVHGASKFVFYKKLSGRYRRGGDIYLSSGYRGSPLPLVQISERSHAFLMIWSMLCAAALRPLAWRGARNAPNYVDARALGVGFVRLHKSALSDGMFKCFL